MGGSGGLGARRSGRGAGPGQPAVRQLPALACRRGLAGAAGRGGRRGAARAALPALGRVARSAPGLLHCRARGAGGGGAHVPAAASRRQTARSAGLGGDRHPADAGHGPRAVRADARLPPAGAGRPARAAALGPPLQHPRGRRAAAAQRGGGVRARGRPGARARRLRREGAPAAGGGGVRGASGRRLGTFCVRGNHDFERGRDRLLRDLLAGRPCDCSTTARPRPAA